MASPTEVILRGLALKLQRDQEQARQAETQQRLKLDEALLRLNKEKFKADQLKSEQANALALHEVLSGQVPAQRAQVPEFGVGPLGEPQESFQSVPVTSLPAREIPFRMQSGETIQLPVESIEQKQEGEIRAAQLETAKRRASQRPVALSAPAILLPDGNILPNPFFTKQDKQINDITFFKNDRKGFEAMKDIEARIRARYRPSRAQDIKSTELVDTIVSSEPSQGKALFNSLTPTMKGKVAPELFKKGFTDFGKPLSDVAIARITKAQSAIDQLKRIRQLILDNQDALGPLNIFTELNPFSKVREIRAKMDLARQIVGKAIEEGVLRAEDEKKYQIILNNIYDVPELALSKVDNVLLGMQAELDNFISIQATSGRSVNIDIKSREKGEKGTTTKPTAASIMEKHGIGK